MDRAQGPRQSTSVYGLDASASAPIVRMPRSAHQPIASIYSGPVQIGSRNAEPIAPRKAFGENGSVVPAVAITPVTPAASAVRKIAPTFTGLLILCITTRKGEADCLFLNDFSSFAGREASRTIPCGVFV